MSGPERKRAKKRIKIEQKKAADAAEKLRLEEAKRAKMIANGQTPPLQDADPKGEQLILKDPMAEALRYAQLILAAIKTAEESKDADLSVRREAALAAVDVYLLHKKVLLAAKALRYVPASDARHPAVVMRRIALAGATQERLTGGGGGDGAAEAVPVAVASAMRELVLDSDPELTAADGNIDKYLSAYKTKVEAAVKAGSSGSVRLALAAAQGLKARGDNSGLALLTACADHATTASISFQEAIEVKASLTKWGEADAAAAFGQRVAKLYPHGDSVGTYRSPADLLPESAAEDAVAETTA